MTYKAQIGDARYSGSVVFEGSLEASSSSITGSNLSLSDATSLAGAGLSNSSGLLRILTGGITNSMISGSISTSKLNDSSMSIASITSTLGGSEPSASAVATQIDSEPMAITNIQDLDVFAAGNLTVFNTISDTLTIASSSTDIVIPGDLTSNGGASFGSELLVEDNYITLNSRYTSDTEKNAGFLINVFVSGNVFTASAGAPFQFSAGYDDVVYLNSVYGNVTGQFNVGDLFMITNAEDVENNGIYEVKGKGWDGRTRIWFRTCDTSHPNFGETVNANLTNIAELACFTPNSDDETTIFTHKPVLAVLRTKNSSNELEYDFGCKASEFGGFQSFYATSFTDLSGSYALGNSSNVISSSPYTIGTDDAISLIDSSGGTILTRLPTITSANVGKIYIIKDYAGFAATNGITIQDINYSDIDGNASIQINSDYGAAKLVAYSGSSGYGYRIL